MQMHTSQLPLRLCKTNNYLWRVCSPHPPPPPAIARACHLHASNELCLLGNCATHDADMCKVARLANVTADVSPHACPINLRLPPVPCVCSCPSLLCHCLAHDLQSEYAQPPYLPSALHLPLLITLLALHVHPYHSPRLCLCLCLFPPSVTSELISTYASTFELNGMATTWRCGC